VFIEENGSRPGVRLRKPPKHRDKNRGAVFAKRTQSPPPRRSSHLGGRGAQVLKIGHDCAKHLKEPYRSPSHEALLYDDRDYRYLWIIAILLAMKRAPVTVRWQLRKLGAAGYLQQALLKPHW
jgi:hypothetical protein